MPAPPSSGGGCVEVSGSLPGPGDEWKLPPGSSDLQTPIPSTSSGGRKRVHFPNSEADAGFLRGRSRDGLERGTLEKGTSFSGGSRPSDTETEQGGGTNGLRNHFATQGRSKSLTSVVNREHEEEEEVFIVQEEAAKKVLQDTRGSQFVFRGDSVVRKFWTALIYGLLVYTGTIFIYRLCFVELRINDDSEEGTTFWSVFEGFAMVVFWIDLFANFFFSYYDALGREVVSMPKIAINYLTGDFVVNAAACIPEAVFRQIVAVVYPRASDATSFNQSVRALRIQRVARIMRLARLSRVISMARAAKNRWWRVVSAFKGMRIVNLGLSLMWIVHILACGWYLVAALHEDPRMTWVARRKVNPLNEDESLLERGPFEQWLNAFYFILTVVVTIGFGDISALQPGEIIYCIFTMSVGAVVHSVVISEVIHVVTSRDRMNEFISKHVELVEAFSEHTELLAEAEKDMKAWVTLSARIWLSNRYDTEEMKQLLTGKYMPRSLLNRLPPALFRGRLTRNNFLRVCDGLCPLPPRLPLLLALALHRSEVLADEIVYEVHDLPSSIFLVLSGTFAFVANPNRPVIRYQDPGNFEAPPAAAGAIAMLTRRASFNVISERSTEKSENSNITQSLYPYQLFSAGSYFGDVEVVQGKPRLATARCESEAGSLLICLKADFKALAEEFPQFGARWRSKVQDREWLRQRCQERLTKGLPFRHLAAINVQKFWRWRREALAEEDGVRKTKKLLGGSLTVAEKRHVALLSLQSAEDKSTKDIQELKAGLESVRAEVATLMETNREVAALLRELHARRPSVDSAPRPVEGEPFPHSVL